MAINLSNNPVPSQDNIPSDAAPGIIFPTSQTGKFNQTGPSVYTDYQVVNRFEKDRHRYMMGIASPGGFKGKSVAFVQLASPTLLWIADWTACRFGAQPNLPSTTPADGDWVLLDDHWEPEMLLIAPNGTTQLYRISGTYIYGHVNPDEDTFKNISYARPPWLDDAFSRTIVVSSFEQSIVDVKAGFPVIARP